WRRLQRAIDQAGCDRSEEVGSGGRHSRRDRLRRGGGGQELPQHRGRHRRPGERGGRRRRDRRQGPAGLRGGPEGARGEGGLMDARQVIIEPVVSEKSYALMAEGKYTFRVHDRAHKLQVAQAIEEIFEVKVRSVRTAKVNSKPKRRGLHSGRSRSW